MIKKTVFKKQNDENVPASGQTANHMVFSDNKSLVPNPGITFLNQLSKFDNKLEDMKYWAFHKSASLARIAEQTLYDTIITDLGGSGKIPGRSVLESIAGNVLENDLKHEFDMIESAIREHFNVDPAEHIEWNFQITAPEFHKKRNMVKAVFQGLMDSLCSAGPNTVVGCVSSVLLLHLGDFFSGTKTPLIGKVIAPMGGIFVTGGKILLVIVLLPLVPVIIDRIRKRMDNERKLQVNKIKSWVSNIKLEMKIYNTIIKYIHKLL
ncbi:MAG: hypothetical protein ABIA63_07120 [bacterium]